MDQEITGAAGIASAEAFGGGSTARIDQTIIQGLAGIPSEENFPPPSGVFIDRGTVPYSVSIAY